MSPEWQPPGEEWEPPKDPEKYAEWVAKFPEGLVEFGLREGLTHAQLEELRRLREAYRTEQLEAAQRGVAELRGRLRKVCPEERWPAVFPQGFARVPTMPEPERTELIALLGQWVEGIERAYGGALRPELTCSYFESGIKVGFTIPRPCEMTCVYYRLRGRAVWQMLGIYTSPVKYFYTSPEDREEAEAKDWPGRMMEFVAVGRFEEAHFGFPSEVVALKVPEQYPVIAKTS